MVLVRTRRLLSFIDQRWNDKYQLVIAKKEVEFDYVGIDVSSLVGIGLRMAKSVTTEQRRHKEVARHVTQHLHQVLKRFHAKKGIGLFLDGSETLYKAHLNRTSTVTRRLESRLQRLPATQLMQTVEDRVVRMMPENRTFPGEVVFSGTCVPGPVELKMSAWALDVASQDLSGAQSTAVVSASTDSVCLIGGSELYLNSLALTPYFNIYNMVQHNSDFKQMRLQDSLEWLTMDKLAKDGDHTSLSKMRSDVLLLYLISNGCSATEMGAVPQLLFADLMKVYLSHVEQSDIAEGNKPRYIFSEEPGIGLVLQLEALTQVLSKSLRNKGSLPPPRHCPLSESYIELALQSHRLLTHGHLGDPYFMPLSSTPLIVPLIGHLLHLCSRDVTTMTPRVVTALPLTAAEYTLLSNSQTLAVEACITNFVGSAPKPDVARSIATDAVIESALKRTREIFSFANPSKPHKALCFSPSYCWLQNQKSKLWTFYYVDLGEKSLELDARRLKGSAARGASMQFAVSTDGPCHFDANTKTWAPVSGFPIINASGGVASRKEHHATIKFLSWNVMFDRYSGKPTPLGMPGIDWCTTKRYPVLSKVMEAADADVIGMQEVEPAFWEFLSREQWVQDRYIFSCNKSGPAINPWGVLMMVHRRMSVSQLAHHNVPAWSGHMSLLPVLTIDLNGRPLHVAAIHLIAPFTKGRESARTGQDNALRMRMTKSISGDCITMGDFNDWPTNEFLMPDDSSYVEAWPLVHANDPGKTMDETNTFCKLKIEEIFFGRSDKFFFRGKRLKPIAARLVGTKSVNDENGNHDAPAYLFPSDHYGVEMTFAVGG